METGEIVGTHDPDEMHMRIAGPNEFQRSGRIARAQCPLECRHLDPWISGQRFAGGEAFGKRCQLLLVLQWIAGCYQPPQLVEAQAPQGDLGHKQVSRMRRVEGTAEETDHHATFDMWHHGMPMGECRFRHVRDGPGRCRGRDI